jgi:3',5'-cyclic AMP phosphodiesterase CpdA
MAVLPISVILAAIALFSLAGCGGGTDTSVSSSSAGVTAPRTASTATVKPNYTFAVCGDNRTEGIDSGVLQRIIDSAKSRGAAFVIDTGDVSEGGSRGELVRYRDLVDGSGIKFYTVPGNHDVGAGGLSETYTSIIGDTHYSFDYHGDHFIILDNADDKTGIDDAQMQWFSGDLAANAARQHQFIFTHIPVADPSLPSQHVTGEQGGVGLRSGQQMVEAAGRYANVSDFFFGHIHAYLAYKLNGINAYVTGGAGAPLYFPEGSGGFYHYLLVSVLQDGVDVQVVHV